MNASYRGIELSSPLQRAGRIGELSLPHVANAEFVMGRSKARSKLNQLQVFLHCLFIITLLSVLGSERKSGLQIGFRNSSPSRLLPLDSSGH
jgi:hypothetical protein